LKSVSMMFTTNVRMSTVVPQRAPTAQKKAVAAEPVESYIYRSPTTPVVKTAPPKSVKQSLAGMFKNIQVKKSCRSCGGFK